MIRLAEYIMVEKSVLRKLAKLGPKELRAEMTKLRAEKEDREIFFLGSYWEGMLFLFSGESTPHLLENNPLREAVLGAWPLETGLKETASGEHLSFLELEDLYRVIRAMGVFEHNTKIDKENLLADEFEELKAFYKRARRQKNGVIVHLYPEKRA